MPIQRCRPLCTLVLLVLAGASAAQPAPPAASPPLAPDPAAVARHYNTVLGTQTFGVRYTFTEDDALVETAKAIRATGSNLLKIGLGDKYHGEWYSLPKRDDVHTLRDLVSRHPSYRAVLEMDFDFYHFWVYPMTPQGWWDDGLSDAEAQQEYREVYDLTAYLLHTFSGSGKAFYLGHWEGDWHLHPDYDGSKDPSPVMLRGMIDWLNTRQRAIDDARRATPHHGVSVYHYTEVCLVDKAMRGGTTLTNDVLPHTSVDYVSYSSYDRLNWGGEGLPLEAIGPRLTAALDYIASKLPPKPAVPGRRVFIGEYGFPLRAMGTPAKQERYSRAVARAGLEWGCPFVLYWAMYCNENKDGSHRGFWLIDEHGQKQPIYHTLRRYQDAARAWVADYTAEHGRAPSAEAFADAAVGLLDAAAPSP